MANGIMKSTAGSRNLAEKTNSAAAAALAAVSARMTLQMVCMAGPAQVQQVMDELIARGEAVYEDDPQDEMAELDQALDEMDGEVSLADEDAEPMEPAEGDSAFDDGTSPLVGDAFEIIVDVSEGEVELDMPENEWEGVRPVSNLAKYCLDHISKRMRTYAAIARYLGEEYPELLQQGPTVFRTNYRAIRQKDFLRRLEKVEKESLSRYLNGARLVWPEGAIPLRSLFAE